MKIYLAAPYSHLSPKVRQRRFEMVNYKSAWLMKQGHIVFSPISHSHPIAVQEELPLSADFWKDMNHSFIDWCDVVYVFCINGWHESVGIQEEIQYAESINKPVNFLEVN